MNRTTSSSSIPHRDEEEDPLTPPWEQHALPQIPYLEAGSPSLSNAEREALPDLWAISSYAAPKHRPSASTERKISTSRDGCTSPPPNARADSLSPNTIARWTSVPTRESPLPYETHTYSRSSPRPTPSRAVTTQSTPQRPPTPPDRLSKAESFSTSASSPAMKSAPAITALPGTMSSRSRTTSGSKSAHRTHGTSRRQKADTPGVGKRFTLALKDIFKRNPVDDSDFEYLDARHWTEEA